MWNTRGYISGPIILTYYITYIFDINIKTSDGIGLNNLKLNQFNKFRKISSRSHPIIIYFYAKPNLTNSLMPDLQ